MTPTQSRSPVEILKSARELIATPEKWTQGCAARGKSGREVFPEGRNAVCFCSIGALTRAGDEYDSAARGYLRDAIDNPFVVDWNDKPGRTHAEVLAAFDRAMIRLPADVTPSDALLRVLDGCKQHVATLGEHGRVSGLVDMYDEAIRVVEAGIVNELERKVA